MKLSSTHNHSTGSDGKLSPEEVVKKAIELKWEYIYFTDHYPNPREVNIKFKDKDFFNKNYVSEVKQLKEKYKDKIEVYLGVELGWLENYSNWLKEQLKKQNFDYVIGSIHDIIDKDNKSHPVEWELKGWIEGAEKFGGAENYVKEYYKQIKLMIKSGLFDSVGHLDYISVYNRKNNLFSEDSDWYKKEIFESLDLIKKHKMALEINASGIRKREEQFPSLWILKEARKRNIPITLGLDAHYPENFDSESMKKIIDIAKQAGYNEVVRFEKRKMIKEKI